MGRADLHIHTDASDGLASIGEVLDYAENQARLDIVAITDHDDLSPGLRARDLAQKWGFRCAVIPGMEITTLQGHLVALFLETQVHSMRSLTYTIEAVHAQGGICVVPHPFSWLVHSVGQSQLENLLQRHPAQCWPDAIELGNPTPAGRVTRRAARKVNSRVYRLAEVGGSDAHFAPLVGSGFTRFAGRTPEDLKEAILTRGTRPGTVAPHEQMKLRPAEVALQTIRALVFHPRKLVRRVALQALGEIL